MLNGSRLRNGDTNLWAMLYARVRQADGSAFRNVLINRMKLVETPPPPVLDRPNLIAKRTIFGEGLFKAGIITSSLERLGLPPGQSLTVLAAEVFINAGARKQNGVNTADDDPLGERLGFARILRISPLISVPDAC